MQNICVALSLNGEESLKILSDPDLNLDLHQNRNISSWSHTQPFHPVSSECVHILLRYHAILLRGRDVGRGHDRWMEPQVCSTDRPEFRSSPRISPESTGPLSDRNSPMDRPSGVGSIANFNLPKYPHGPTTGEIHPRRNSYENEPLSALVPCAIPSSLIAENRWSKCPLRAVTALTNSQSRVMSNQ